MECFKFKLTLPAGKDLAGLVEHIEPAKGGGGKHSPCSKTSLTTLC